MVKKLYSSVASVLLISMLAVNLQSFAIIESAVNDSVDLSQYFNYDIVKNTTDKMDREYGDKSLMYSREANLIADDMTVTLGEKVFQLNLEYDGADVIKVDETIGTVTVEFPEMYVKSVDLVISSENGSGETDIVLNYNDADKTTASDTLKVYQMTDSTEGFSMGLSMIRYDSRYIKKFVEMKTK